MESRISNVDVAGHMTAFVHDQILSQSAAIMLVEADSMPQTAMRLVEA